MPLIGIKPVFVPFVKDMPLELPCVIHTVSTASGETEISVELP
jgi:hypothetical protein